LILVLPVMVMINRIINRLLLNQNRNLDNKVENNTYDNQHTLSHILGGLSLIDVKLTCVNDHLWATTTCQQRPESHLPLIFFRIPSAFFRPQGRVVVVHRSECTSLGIRQINNAQAQAKAVLYLNNYNTAPYTFVQFSRRCIIG
jgi:hypothetical protein